MPRWDARTDGLHAIIREAVRRAGYTWHDTFRCGGGYPDATVISKSGVIAFVEVKSEKGELNKAERAFWDACTGPKVVARTPEDALAFLEQLDEMRLEYAE